MRKILNQKEENRKKMHKQNKTCLNKAEKFYQEIRQGTYFICSVSSVPSEMKHHVKQSPIK